KWPPCARPDDRTARPPRVPADPSPAPTECTRAPRSLEVRLKRWSLIEVLQLLLDLFVIAGKAGVHYQCRLGPAKPSHKPDHHSCSDSQRQVRNQPAERVRLAAVDSLAVVFHEIVDDLGIRDALRLHLGNLLFRRMRKAAAQHAATGYG